MYESLLCLHSNPPILYYACIGTLRDRPTDIQILTNFASPLRRWETFAHSFCNNFTSLLISWINLPKYTYMYAFFQGYWELHTILCVWHDWILNNNPAWPWALWFIIIVCVSGSFESKAIKSKQNVPVPCDKTTNKSTLYLQSNFMCRFWEW